VDNDKANSWTDKDVLLQWHKGFKGTLLTQKFVKDKDLNKLELKTVNECIIEYHHRLIEIIWLMRLLSQPIAKQANKEDNCTGHFYSL
jgi:hypothetical protein